MPRRWSFGSAMILFTFVFVASACSNVSSPPTDSHVGAARIHEKPQSPGTWTTKASMPTARSQLAVSVLNGILYAVGGTNDSGVLNTVEAYDPTTDSWTTKTPMPTPRSDLTMRAVGRTLRDWRQYRQQCLA
jgi:hypothetical protein